MQELDVLLLFIISVKIDYFSSYFALLIIHSNTF